MDERDQISKNCKRIYCAGPLFTDKEREEMEQIASTLEDAGYATFLPQRDGLELSKCVECLVHNGTAPDEAGMLMSQAIFALDVYQVLHRCDALVANLNGRAPDEGTVSEAAMAWTRGKPIVGYKADSRTAFDGQDNPLVAGLFAFSLCDSIEELPRLLKGVICFSQGAVGERVNDGYFDLGEKLSSTMKRDYQIDDIVEIVNDPSMSASTLLVLSQLGVLRRPHRLALPFSDGTARRSLWAGLHVPLPLTAFAALLLHHFYTLGFRIGPLVRYGRNSRQAAPSGTPCTTRSDSPLPGSP